MDLVGPISTSPGRRAIDRHTGRSLTDGSSVVVQGAGLRNSKTGRVGSLMVEVVVEDHPVFQREGSDVLVESRVDFVTAILGGEIQVPTIDGEVLVRVKPGTQPNDRLLLRGRGIRAEGQLPGDQIVNVK